MYQIVLCWKTYKYYYYEADELPDPRLTQPNEKLGEKWHLGHFSPQQIFFRGLGLIYIGNRLHET